MKWLIILCSYLVSRSTVFCDTVTESVEAAVEGLKKDVSDILHMIPKEKITNIAIKHLETDDGFKAAVKYMTEPEWVNRVETIRAKPEWIAFKNHLISFGIPMDTLITCMETFTKNITIGELKDKNAKKNLTSFIIDVGEVIPVTEMLVKFNEKMQSSSHMQLLLEKLSQPESKKIFEDALRLPEIRKMLNELKEMGLNLYELFTLLYIFLGWGEFKL